MRSIYQALGAGLSSWEPDPAQGNQPFSGETQTKTTCKMQLFKIWRHIL